MNSSKNISKKEMNKKSSTMRLIAYMKPYAHWVIFALLLVLGLTAFDLYRPMLVGDAIDTFGANGDYDVIIATAIKYAVVLALSFAFNIAQTWILQKTGQNIILQMGKDLYRHIQSLGSRYFDITPVGKLVTRVTNDVEALNEMYSGILVQLFRNIVKIVGLAGVMLVLDVRLAAISFVLMPLVIGLTVLYQKIARNIYRLYRTRLTDINTFLSEHLSGMKIIQIFGRQERKFEEFHDKNTKLYKAFYREMLMYAVFRPLIYILSILSLMIVLWFGSRNVFDEIISVGTLYIFSNYIRSFFDPIQELQSSFQHCSHQLHQQRRYLRLWMRMNLFLRSKIQSSRIKSPEKLNLTMSGLPMTAKTMCLRMSHLSLIRARRWPLSAQPEQENHPF